MRIFLSGDEDTAKWHLPVAQAKFNEFISRCKASGLKQDRFTFIFDDTGTQVFGQYSFGQSSLQIYSPISVPVEEESEETTTTTSCPRTFYIETPSGYFWVIVRRDDENKLTVSLEPFEAFKSGTELAPEFIYPGMGHQTTGMLAGVINDERFVITQKACVFYGDCEKKGTIKLPASMESGRITIAEDTEALKRYIIVSGNHVSRSVSEIKITSTDDVSLRFFNIDSMLAATNGVLNATMLSELPTWVHRKCYGNYFNPQKTIGFHVDLGSDDSFVGNLDAIPSGRQDKLSEYFNHSSELYSFASMIQYPLSINGEIIAVLLVSPTMFSFTKDMCWGGYGFSYGADCLDYMMDTGNITMSPRLVSCIINLSTGEYTFEEIGKNVTNGAELIAFDTLTWDGQYKASFVVDITKHCDTRRVLNQDTDIIDDCFWESTVALTCSASLPYEYIDRTVINEQKVQRLLTDYGRENIINRKLFYFIPGGQSPSPVTANNAGYFFLFEGLWHLDAGVLWANTAVLSDYCNVCSLPESYQLPGEEITFFLNVGREEADWILAHGHEYVKNLEIVEPLGFRFIWWPANAAYIEKLCFVAKVPENFAAPHEPEVLTGGVTYTSEDVVGKDVSCERSLMSAPCDCEGNTLEWSAGNLEINTTQVLSISGGCPPYAWFCSNATFTEGGKYLYGNILSAEVTTKDCQTSVSVRDVCGNTIRTTAILEESSWSVSGITTLMETDTERNFSPSFAEGVQYSGSLPFISKTGNLYKLKMPKGCVDGTLYTVEFTGSCGRHAEGVTYCYNNSCDWPGTVKFGEDPWPGVGAIVQHGTSYINQITEYAGFTRLSIGNSFVGDWMYHTILSPITGSYQLYYFYVYEYTADTGATYSYAYNFNQICP